MTRGSGSWAQTILNHPEGRERHPDVVAGLEHGSSGTTQCANIGGLYAVACPYRYYSHLCPIKRSCCWDRGWGAPQASFTMYCNPPPHAHHLMTCIVLSVLTLQAVTHGGTSREMRGVPVLHVTDGGQRWTLIPA